MLFPVAFIVLEPVVYLNHNPGFGEGGNYIEEASSTPQPLERASRLTVSLNGHLNHLRHPKLLGFLTMFSLNAEQMVERKYAHTSENPKVLASFRRLSYPMGYHRTCIVSYTI